MEKPTEKQLQFIANLAGLRDNKFYSAAYAEIFRQTGAKQAKATKADASATIDALKRK